jgi:hypothetical protein
MSTLFYLLSCAAGGDSVTCPSKFHVIWVVLSVLAIVIIAFFLSFWIKMLVHAITHEISNKGFWIVIILITNILGAVTYYFSVKKNYDKNNIQPYGINGGIPKKLIITCAVICCLIIIAYIVLNN